MEIVVLDGYTLNPGDLSWTDLENLGSVKIYERTKPDEILERADKATILLTNKTVLTKETIQQLPNLRYIGVLATGYDVVDVQAAQSANIPVTNVPAYSTESVAQMVFAHILNLTQHVGEHSKSVKSGKWSISKDFCYWEHPLIELSGLTLGIVGYGKTGKAVAKIAQAFNMKVIVSTRSPVQEDIESTDLETLFKNSDIISLHCPLTQETHELVNAKLLQLMKKTAYLINTSRGSIINPIDLANALNKNQIAGAGLDVLEKEPPDPESPLLKAKNCYITPHISWATMAARQRLYKTAVENIQAFIAGKCLNRING